MFINPLNRKYSTIRKFVDRILSPEQDSQHHRGKYGGKGSGSSLRGGSSSSSIQSSGSGGSSGSFGYRK